MKCRCGKLADYFLDYESLREDYGQEILDQVRKTLGEAICASCLEQADRHAEGDFLISNFMDYY